MTNVEEIPSVSVTDAVGQVSTQALLRELLFRLAEEDTISGGARYVEEELRYFKYRVKLGEHWFIVTMEPLGDLVTDELWKEIEAASEFYFPEEDEG